MPSTIGSRKKLKRSFYARGAEVVARELLGKILVHSASDGTVYRARIVETEAYVGPHDLAAHSSKGRTKRTEVMFGPPGYAYVYLCYGMYELLNVVTATEGDPQAVLLRAGESLEKDTPNLSGPGKLTRGLRIDRSDYGADFCGSKLYFLDGPAPKQIGISARIGVDYAKEWKDAPLRFFDRESKAVSGRKGMNHHRGSGNRQPGS